MEKIAIKYSEENWPEIKKAVDLIRSQGIKVGKRKNECSSTMSEANYLSNDPIFNGFEYTVETKAQVVEEGFIILTMPQDMPKLKEVLGIEVCEPKDGEAWISKERIVRFKEINDLGRVVLYTQVDVNDSKFYLDARNYHGVIQHKATPEETTKLIKAEHSNGYHWDGSSLVKIPEYFYSKLRELICEVGDYNHNIGKHSVKHQSMYVGVECIVKNSRTKEAYEAQEVEKKRPLKLLFGNSIKTGLNDFDFVSFPYNFLQCPCVKTEAEFKEHLAIINKITNSKKKPPKRIILNQYESIEILVDEFEMVHGDGKILLTGKNK